MQPCLPLLPYLHHAAAHADLEEVLDVAGQRGAACKGGRQEGGKKREAV